MIAEAAAAGARLVVLTEMFSTGFSMATDRIAEPSTARARSSSSSRRARTASGCAARVPERSPDGTPRSGPATSSCSRHPTARRTATPSSTRSRTRASTSTTPRATARSPSTSRACGSALRLLRPAVRRRVLGARAATPTATSCWPTGPEPRTRPLARAARGACDREPGVRRRRQPRRRGRSVCDYAGDSLLVVAVGRDPRSTAPAARSRCCWPRSTPRSWRRRVSATRSSTTVVRADWRSSRDRRRRARASIRGRSVPSHVWMPGCNRRDAVAEVCDLLGLALRRPDDDRVQLGLDRDLGLRLPAVDDARLGGCLRAASRRHRIRVVRRRLRVLRRHHDPRRAAPRPAACATPAPPPNPTSSGTAMRYLACRPRTGGIPRRPPWPRRRRTHGGPGTHRRQVPGVRPRSRASRRSATSGSLPRDRAPGCRRAARRLRADASSDGRSRHLTTTRRARTRSRAA